MGRAVTILACFFGVAVWFAVGWTARGVSDRVRQVKLMRKLRADALAQLALLFGAQPNADGSRCDCPACTLARHNEAKAAN